MICVRLQPPVEISNYLGVSPMMESSEKELEATEGVPGKKRRKFKLSMPHLLWLMAIILGLVSLLTYLIPAGEFNKDADGNVDPDTFHYLAENTPVDPLTTMMSLLDGLTAAAPIVFAVMVVGASVEVVLASKSFENILNWAIYKLKDKGSYLLLSVLFCLMVYIGGFAGSDALIAVVPIGVLFARRLHLDAVVAMGVTTFAALIGFGTGPQPIVIPQLFIDLPPYSGFFVRFAIMNFFMVVGLIMLMLYVRKIRKDPTKSLMYNEGWRPEEATASTTEVNTAVTAEKLSWRSIAIIVIFVGQFGLIIAFTTLGDSDLLLNFMVALFLVTAVINGIIARFDANTLANTIAKGLADMAFVGFIIGLARVVSIILEKSNIIDTVVYFLTRPLLNVGLGPSTVAMVIIFAAINFIIPSATAKAAILIPIVSPVAMAIGLDPQLAIQAFQFGDGFTNQLSPVLAWLLGSCAMAGISYGKWVRWVFPKVLIFLVLSCLIMLLLTAVGWTGGV
jgi:uncharacterized ion transporter superfamily protein YfcC